MLGQQQKKIPVWDIPEVNRFFGNMWWYHDLAMRGALHIMHLDRQRHLWSLPGPCLPVQVFHCSATWRMEGYDHWTSVTGGQLQCSDLSPLKSATCLLNHSLTGSATIRFKIEPYLWLQLTEDLYWSHWSAEISQGSAMNPKQELDFAHRTQTKKAILMARLLI